jgi:colanic acid/amylovoran biosynthesis glycosyltransferase
MGVSEVTAVLKQVTVGHVVLRYGALSESFIPDALEALESAGASNYVTTLAVDNRATYPYPPAERLIVCPEPPTVMRVLHRLQGRRGNERFAATAASELRPHEPQIVHGQFGWGGASAVPVARRLDVPSVVTFHGSDVTMIPIRSDAPANGWRGPRGHSYEQFFGQLDLAFVVSSFIERRVRELGFAGRTEIVPAGVSLERLRYRERQPPDDAGLRILYLGRLTPQKGLSVLLDAMPRVLAAVPDTQLDVIGGGPLDRALRKQAQRLGIGDAVVFHGPLPGREDVVEVMRHAHVQVVPSRAMPNGQAEGSPVVTKEAQAAGVPLVATDSGGLIDTLPPEHRGDIVPSDDSATLAERIIALLADPAARQQRAEVARAWVEREFDQMRLAEKTISLYEQALK